MKLGLEHRYPEHVLSERKAMAREGGFREQVRYDLVKRPHYAFGLLAAADIARFAGVGRVTAIEFGVANGGGLLNLCELAPQVTKETGVEFEIIGVDNAAGLPELAGHRDHPEIWHHGDFEMTNQDEIRSRLPSFARLMIGEASATIASVVSSLSGDAPVGFVSHDMDLYSSTAACMPLYEEAPTKLLPVSIAYFDDTLGSPRRMGTLMRNDWCGQLLAIREFNERNALRKIDGIRTLEDRRPLRHELWLKKIYAVHALDHPMRSVEGNRAAAGQREHEAAAALEWPL